MARLETPTPDDSEAERQRKLHRISDEVRKRIQGGYMSVDDAEALREAMVTAVESVTLLNERIKDNRANIESIISRIEGTYSSAPALKEAVGKLQDRVGELEEPPEWVNRREEQRLRLIFWQMVSVPVLVVAILLFSFFG